MAIIRNGITTHTGLVLELTTSTFNEGYDTIYQAIVWDAATQKPKTVGYGDTMSPDTGKAVVDATPEVRAAYEALRAARRAAVEAERAEEQAKLPTKGKEVKVVRGRKLPIGTVGRVFWYGENQFGFSVGIELIDGKRVFTAAKNVIVTAQVAA